MQHLGRQGHGNILSNRKVSYTMIPSPHVDDGRSIPRRSAHDHNIPPYARTRQATIVWQPAVPFEKHAKSVHSASFLYHQDAIMNIRLYFCILKNSDSISVPLSLGSQRQGAAG